MQTFRIDFPIIEASIKGSKGILKLSKENGMLLLQEL